MIKALTRLAQGDRRALGLLVNLLLGGLMGGVALASIATGPVNIPVGQIISVLSNGWWLPADGSQQSVEQILVYSVRIPRTLAGLLVGSALAVAGAMMQSLFRNPLADPGLVGVSSGAALGAVLAIVLGSSIPLIAWLGIAMVPAMAFIGGLISTLLLYKAATRQGLTSTATMLLAGLGIGALTSAITAFIVYLSDDAQLRDLTYWFMGGLGGATWKQLLVSAPLILALIFGAPLLARGLDALVLGEATARHLGIEVQWLKRTAIIMVALAVGAAVSLAGIVGFVGIIVPHLLRMLIGPEHHTLLPATALLGGTLTIAADMLCRTIVAPAELPLGILTAAIGAPVFLYILLRGRGLIEL